MTKTITGFATLAALAATLSMPALAENADSTAELSKGEQELAELLEGYEAGEPVNCLSRFQRDRLRVIDGTALVFRNGRTIYVNRTSAPQFIDDFDLPVFKPFGTNLCRLDQVEFIDRFGGFRGPVVSLNEFIPYTRTAADD